MPKNNKIYDSYNQTISYWKKNARKFWMKLVTIVICLLRVSESKNILGWNTLFSNPSVYKAEKVSSVKPITYRTISSFSIEFSVDTLRPVEKYWTLINWILFLTSELWWAENNEKCYYHWILVDLQTRYRSKLPVPAWSHPAAPQ